MKVQVVTGANYGDEGKGLVAGCLAKEANKKNERTLTVFYNGTSQRAHTFEGEIHRCMAAGTKYGSDTFYYRKFVVDPTSLFLCQAKPIIDPECRIILPCDVLTNRKKEQARGTARHGSCGFGLFEAVLRSSNPASCIKAKDLLNPYALYYKVKELEKVFKSEYDDLYNLSNFMTEAEYIIRKCRIASFEEIVNDYDTIIFEGGQGLLLDQDNIGDFPHLTPSSTGGRFISNEINKMDVPIELFYVSRSYLTRHGAGPMPGECLKSEINDNIVDLTNVENEFQGGLRFGKLNMKSFKKRIERDAMFYKNKTINCVFTHLNYTDNKLDTIEGRKEIDLPWANVYVSDQRDTLERR